MQRLCADSACSGYTRVVRTRARALATRRLCPSWGFGDRPGDLQPPRPRRPGKGARKLHLPLAAQPRDSMGGRRLGTKAVRRQRMQIAPIAHAPCYAKRTRRSMRAACAVRF